MSFTKVGRRLGHISTARLAAQLEADTYETEHVNWTNIQDMIKTKGVARAVISPFGEYPHGIDKRAAFHDVFG